MSNAVHGPRGSMEIPDGKTSKDSSRPITIKVNARINGIVRSYLEHRKQDISSLFLALAEGEFAHIENVAHDLIGTGGSFGFKHMSIIGRSLEKAAKGRQSEEIKILLEGLAEYLSRVEVVHE